jgi:hypothetical protein
VASRPWKHWLPGALGKSQVKCLYQLGLISVQDSNKLEIGACSIDLSLSSRGYLMKRGSIKPFTSKSYTSILQNNVLASRLPQSQDGSFLLRRTKTYVFELRERLDPILGKAGFHGQATAKSSIGRLDVLARLIVDGMDTYECFDSTRLRKSSRNLLGRLKGFLGGGCGYALATSTALG